MLCMYPIVDKCGTVLGYRALSYCKNHRMIHDCILVRSNYHVMTSQLVRAVAPEQLYLARTTLPSPRQLFRQAAARISN